MVDPITATYVQDNEDWTITVAGRGKQLTARAPGIIAARDRAAQLVEKIEPEPKGRTVVHLLNGNALDFTAAYMHARMARPATPPGSADAAVEPDAASSGSDGTPPEASAKQARKRPPARRAATKTASKSSGRRAKKEPAEFNGKHADVGAVLGGEPAEADVSHGSAPV